jgi:hypothetical protein
VTQPPAHRARETWAEVLTRLELDLDAVEAADPAALADSAVTAAPFAPPPDLGPLPAALQDRAVHLQLRMAAAEQRVERAMEDVRKALVVTGRLDPRGNEPAYPRFFDAAL